MKTHLFGDLLHSIDTDDYESFCKTIDSIYIAPIYKDHFEKTFLYDFIGRTNRNSITEKVFTYYIESHLKDNDAFLEFTLKTTSCAERLLHPSQADKIQKKYFALYATLNKLERKNIFNQIDAFKEDMNNQVDGLYKKMTNLKKELRKINLYIKLDTEVKTKDEHITKKLIKI